MTRRSEAIYTFSTAIACIPGSQGRSTYSDEEGEILLKQLSGLRVLRSSMAMVRGNLRVRPFLTDVTVLLHVTVTAFLGELPVASFDWAGRDPLQCMSESAVTDCLSSVQTLSAQLICSEVRTRYESEVFSLSQ